MPKESKPVIIDDDSPITRTFGKSDFTPHWGKNALDRDRDPLSEEEEKVANQIGLPKNNK